MENCISQKDLAFALTSLGFRPDLYNDIIKAIDSNTIPNIDGTIGKLFARTEYSDRIVICEPKKDKFPNIDVNLLTLDFNDPSDVYIEYTSTLINYQEIIGANTLYKEVPECVIENVKLFIDIFLAESKKTMTDICKIVLDIK